MGALLCCCLVSEYAQLVEEISLEDNCLPFFPDTLTKLRDCSKTQTEQLNGLFACFDLNNDNHIDRDELNGGLQKLKKHASNRALDRMIKQMHMSSSSKKDAVEIKGFSMAILSKRSLLYEFLYTDFDTLLEWEEEVKVSESFEMSGK